MINKLQHKVGSIPSEKAPANWGVWEFHPKDLGRKIIEKFRWRRGLFPKTSFFLRPGQKFEVWPLVNSKNLIKDQFVVNLFFFLMSRMLCYVTKVTCKLPHLHKAKKETQTRKQGVFAQFSPKCGNLRQERVCTQLFWKGIPRNRSGDLE